MSADAGASRQLRSDRQHVRQVRLDQPGRAPADGRLRGDARGAVRARRSEVGSIPCSTSAAARACSPSSGRGGSATAGSSGSTCRTRSSKAQWRTRGRANLEFVAGRAEELPFGDDEFDLVAAIETLEHVPDPERTLAEMARVARRHLLVSVPREPLWRALNVARGAYVRELGNTPGHVNHWSKRGFAAAARAPRRGARGPLAVPVDDGRSCGCGDGRRSTDAPGRALAAGRLRAAAEGLLRVGRADPVDRDRLDRDLHVPVPGVREPRARSGLLQPDLAVLGDHVRDPVGDLPADRAAALAHDRRPPRARPARPSAAESRPLIQSSFALLFLVVGAGAAPPDRAGHVRRLERALLDPRDRRAGVRRQLLRARVARRPPALRALRRAGVPGIDDRASCSRSRSRSGSAPARGRSGWAWRWRRSCRCR